MTAGLFGTIRTFSIKGKYQSNLFYDIIWYTTIWGSYIGTAICTGTVCTRWRHHFSRSFNDSRDLQIPILKSSIEKFEVLDCARSDKIRRLQILWT